MVISRKVRCKFKPSEILDPIEFEGFSIRSLRHGNTGHVLYYAPRDEDLECHWTMDLQTAKNGVLKYNSEKEKTPLPVEVTTLQ